MPLRIVRCRQLPVGFAALVEAGTSEGFSFVVRMSREWESGENRFEAEGEALFAAYAGDELVGIGALNVDPFANDPRVARLRHLYVLPRHRGVGAGGALVRAVVAEASRRFGVLRLRTRQAGPFYEKLGFERSSEAEATHALRLGPVSGSAAP